MNYGLLSDMLLIAIVNNFNSRLNLQKVNIWQPRNKSRLPGLLALHGYWVV